MQKTILNQQYENFTASRSEGLDQTYDRFQKLINQLEIHGEVISQEDANLKLLRSLPSAWNNIALIMRNKADLDELSMDDLYNNLKVYEVEIKSYFYCNVAFSIFSMILALYYEASILIAHDMRSGAIDTMIIEVMDLKCGQVAMPYYVVKRILKEDRKENLISMEKESVSFDNTKVVMLQLPQERETPANDHWLFNRCIRKCKYDCSVIEIGDEEIHHGNDRFKKVEGSRNFDVVLREGKILLEKVSLDWKNLDFEDVYFVKELKFNLFSVSQMCDKKNRVFFTETECLVLSPDFKLLDESQVLLKVSRQNNMYSFDLKNVVPSGGLVIGYGYSLKDKNQAKTDKTEHGMERA
ncbi:hypothetical protein Tco_1162439 [Tanacetum coccineum]